MKNIDDIKKEGKKTEKETLIDNIEINPYGLEEIPYEDRTIEMAIKFHKNYKGSLADYYMGAKKHYGVDAIYKIKKRKL